MAQIQRQSTLPLGNFHGRSEQRPPGPQLPPIHSVPPTRPVYDSSGRSVQLPPMQVPPAGLHSPSRAPPTRSIPVAQLLSSNPPSPPRSQPAATAQQPLYRRSPHTIHGSTPGGYSTHPQSYMPAPHHRHDQAPVTYRQPPPPPMFQQEQHPGAQYQRPQYPPAPLATSPEQGAPRQYSPGVSAYSSPTSYSNSEPSPRSSLAPSAHGTTYSQRPPVSKPPPLDFNLSIRQQPAAARACGFGERDRRVIDPPPILELKITDRNGLPEQDGNSMLALTCSLLSPDGKEDETELPPAHPDMPSTRRLMGTLVASPYQAKDENGIAGTFFVFPDLSCRSPGKYRLKFKLLRVDYTNMNIPGAVHNNVAAIVTEVFSVYTAKDFPGMRASSALLKSLRRQGLNVGVKKGSEARKGKGKVMKEAENGSTSSSGGEEDSDGGGGESDGRGGSSSGMSPKTKSRKKGKRRRDE